MCTKGELGTGDWGRAENARRDKACARTSHFSFPSSHFLIPILFLLPGCGAVQTAVSNVFSSGPPPAVDAHTVYRLRPACATLAARTTAHGYTILTPQEGGPFEASGVFEGPARLGASVFRYVPPTAGASWELARDATETEDVSVEVSAVDVELPDVRGWLDRYCGALPPGEGEPGEALPRVPARP